VPDGVAGTRVPIKALFDYLVADNRLNDFLDTFHGFPEARR